VFATLLIIFRVAQGRVWADKTSHEMTTQIRFNPLRRSLEDGSREASPADPGRLQIMVDKNGT
jgi:hypothetical protein